MEPSIPQREALSTGCLSRVFRDTVATYKYYWFISLLDVCVHHRQLRIPIWELITRMVANAWYPIHYFRLSFGKSDSMYGAIGRLRELTGLPVDADLQQVQQTLKSCVDRGDTSVKQVLRVFTRNVPYRFLMPWIGTTDNREMMLRSQRFENGALYGLFQDGKGELMVEVNPVWQDYLAEHYRILLDYTYWNLTNFLQVRNPNVPNIPSKLVRPEQRRPLTRQHKFWDAVIGASGPLRCIYSGRLLVAGQYDLDHFIPWSFVTHDLAWNLLPADPSVNSSKSDRIPDLAHYLPGMASLQRRALETYAGLGREDRLLEDYLSLGYSVPDLLDLSSEQFYEVFYRTFSPIAQIASNMGFETWK